MAVWLTGHNSTEAPAEMDPFDLKGVIKRYIWDVEETRLPPLRGWLIRTLRVIYVVLRDVAQGQITLRAMSLVYTTLLSIVPVLAISFSVLKGLGVHQDRLEPMLLRYLEFLGEQGVEITNQVISFVENVKVGVLGTLGIALLVYTVVSLMQKIERAFNDIWHVKRSRPLSQRFSDYLSVILIGPVLLFTAAGIAASVRSAWVVERLAEIEPFGTLIEAGGNIVPMLMVVGAFTFLYAFIPNVRVRVVSAFVGGVSAAVLWQITGWVFAAVVVNSAKYAAIYSAFATLIILLIWIYLSWLILLIGASISFYHQNPAYRSEEWGGLKLSNRVKERLALHVAQLVCRNYYERKAPWNCEDLARKLRMPLEPVQNILEALEKPGLLRHTGEEPPTYVPGRPPEETPVKDVLDIIRSTEERMHLTADRLPGEPILQGVEDDLEQATAKALEGRTLKDLVFAESPNVAHLPDRAWEA
jgi:membrane protein